MRDLLKLKESLGAEAITVCIVGKEARFTVMDRREGQDIAQTAVFLVDMLTKFVGAPWLIVREGLREFETANKPDHRQEEAG